MELRETWPTCFWCAGITPSDEEVHKRNATLPHFNYDEPDPPLRDAADVAAEWHRHDRQGRFRMVGAGDGA